MESLRQSGLSEGQQAPPSTSSNQNADPCVPQRCVSPRNNIRTQPGHMIRSNSSGGFQHHHHPPSSPSSRNRNICRNNNNNNNHNVTHESNRVVQPSLADLEFPPPPPPEDLDNIQPSVEEASYRFGVSLRHREPSTDSCSSAKSEPTRAPSKGSRPQDRPPSPPSQTPSQETKSPPSEEQPPSPPPSPKETKEESPPPENEDSGDKMPPSNSKLIKNVLPNMMKEMLELKLVAEMKEKVNGQGKESPLNELPSNENNSNNMDNQTPGVDFKANLRKVSTVSDSSSGKQESSIKAQLKKFEMKRDVDDKTNAANVGIVDLKSRLRKVDTNSGKPDEEEEGDDKRRSTGSISSLKKLWEGESSPPETVKEKRWPPDEKPAVPTKPNVKPVAKAAAIYATPGVLASVMEIWQALETSLATLRTAPTITSQNWLQLSDKVNMFHSSCLAYAESSAPPQTRFHLGELLTRLDTQMRQLRSASSRNHSDNLKTLQELQNTLKDIINAVQR